MADNSEKIALLNRLLQEGQITQEMFDSNVAKLMTLKQNLRPDVPARAASLGSVMDQIRRKPEAVLNIADDIKTATPGMTGLGGKTSFAEKMGQIPKEARKAETTSLGRLNGKMGKTLRALGILGPAIGAMSMTDKAMAGDLGAASMEGLDLATDYIPGVGQVKDALRPSEMGEEPTEPVSMEGSVFEEEYDDLANQRRGRSTLLNRMK